jgi:alpha-D-ribose 1-methylphosphonate 5-triphosphate synthase subunit PhnL
MRVLLSVRGLHKSFVLHVLGGRQLLGFKDVSFDVARGAFVAIVGASGSGKSSVLKCLYRTYVPDAGSAVYARADGAQVDVVTALDDVMLDLRAREIGYVSQFLHPTPRVKAIDLAARPLVRRGVVTESAYAIVIELFERLRLPRELWDGYPALFSGGEQQRVNLARALATQPRLLLLDEPTSALDETLQADVVQLLSDARGAGTTMIGVLHDSRLVRSLADAVITMADGELIPASARGG